MGTYRVYSGFRVKITTSLDKLMFHLGGLDSQRLELYHFHYDIFTFATQTYDEHMAYGLIDYDDWRMMLLHFERGANGMVVGYDG